MKQVIILNLPCVKEFLIELRQVVKAVHQVSGRLVKLKCQLSHIKKQVAGIDNKKLSNIDWGEYFISIVSVCPWSLAYWTKQKVDVTRWRGESNVQELGDYVARMWIHPNASARRLSDIHHRLNNTRRHEEWLYSHNTLGDYSTPVPVLIQQNLETLTRARSAIKEKSHGNA